MGGGGKEKKKRRDRSPSPFARGSSPHAARSSRNDGSNAVMAELQRLSGLVATQGNNLSNQVQGVSSQLNELGTRVQAVETGLESCKSTLDKHEQEIQQILQHLKQSDASREMLESKAKGIEQRLATAESSEPQPLDDTFDRPANPTLIKTNSKALIAKEALESEFCKLVERNKLPSDCFKINGPPVSQYFTIQFLGAANLASGRANLVLRGLKQDDGTWERFLVQDPQKQLVQVYLGPDKSPKQVKTEVLAKRLLSVLEGFRFENLHLNRRSGQVLCNWRPLAMVHIESKESSELMWDKAFASELELDTQKVYSTFKTVSAQGSATPIKWERLQGS